MTRRAWRDVKPGERVKLRGREYEVVKIKRDGKRVRVKVRSASGDFKAEVRAKDLVAIVDTAPRKKSAPAAATTAAKPGALSENPWDSQLDRVEALLADKLQARLVGESTDEGAGYYVPPVDLATVASHLALFHGTDPSGFDDELAMLAEHERAHDGAQALAVHHWHTETRPEPTAARPKKKGKKK